MHALLELRDKCRPVPRATLSRGRPELLGLVAGRAVESAFTKVGTLLQMSQHLPGIGKDRWAV